MAEQIGKPEPDQNFVFAALIHVNFRTSYLRRSAHEADDTSMDNSAACVFHAGLQPMATQDDVGTIKRSS